MDKKLNKIGLRKYQILNKMEKIIDFIEQMFYN